MQKYVKTRGQKNEFHNQTKNTQFSSDKHIEEQSKYGSEGELC